MGRSTYSPCDTAVGKHVNGRMVGPLDSEAVEPRIREGTSSEVLSDAVLAQDSPGIAAI
jgi:hypothetical protein